jgi:two-component system, chemotaxis family, CheB/CheR fusion protein
MARPIRGSGKRPEAGRGPPDGSAAGGEPVSEADAQLRRLEAELHRFSKAQELAGIGVWEWSLDSDETWWSPVTYRLWGLTPGLVPPPLDARPFLAEDRQPYEEALAQARETGAFDAEWRVVLPDGSRRWLASTGHTEHYDCGRRMLGVTQDITARKQTEMRMKLLLGELQHRVRNILGVVRSIVGRTVRSATSIDELAGHLDGRLDTLARTQVVFARFGDASVGLEEMVRDEMLSVAAREERITVEGPPLRLRREAAETFALALHELTTNAVKYGALARADGRVSVRWRIVHGGAGARLLLEWQESGVPAVDMTPARSGFGRELIERGLPYELGATTELQFGRGGVRALIEVPLTDQLAELDQLRHEGSS